MGWGRRRGGRGICAQKTHITVHQTGIRNVSFEGSQKRGKKSSGPIKISLLTSFSLLALSPKSGNKVRNLCDKSQRTDEGEGADRKKICFCLLLHSSMSLHDGCGQHATSVSRPTDAEVNPWTDSPGGSSLHGE